MGPLLPFLVALLAVAFFTRADLFFYLLYALLGIYVLGRWWARCALARVSLERHHDHRAFLGQELPVDVELQNRSWLPVLWLRLSDTIPAELGAGVAFRQVISLKPRECLHLSYTLFGRRRGYYRIGPLVMTGGDLLGSAAYEQRRAQADTLIVYPRILPLRDLRFPSQSPFGTLPSRERIFEDPSRVRGVRDYADGDSLRRIDWRTSARVGRLQVRRYEPAIALSTAVLLNLNAADYEGAERYEATELGIVIAASAVVHLTEKRQAVALATNGRDPLSDRGDPVQETSAAGPPSRRRRGPTEVQEVGTAPEAHGGLPGLPSLPLRKGREHLMDLLDLLARVAMAPEGEAVPFLELLRRKSLGLPWGSTVLVITAREVDLLLDTLLALRRRGLQIVLVCTCADRGFAATAQRAEQIGVRAVQICSEREMDLWR